MTGYKQTVGPGVASGLVLLVLLGGCGIDVDDADDQAPTHKRISYKRQPKFKAEDLTFVDYQQSAADGRGALFGTCLHVPMLDAQGRTWDCELGITLPQHVSGERWPRIVDEAARQVALAMNDARTGLSNFDNADARTCRAFQQMVTARLTQKRNGWKGSQIIRCSIYSGRELPDFYFRRNPLLIGDYREWSKQPAEKTSK